MGAPLKPRRVTPDEALAIAGATAPHHPPAVQAAASPPPPAPAAAPEKDVPTTLNLRMRLSTIRAIEGAAKAQGLTMKQVVANALRAAGVPVAEADLEDRTPRRKDA